MKFNKLIILLAFVCLNVANSQIPLEKKAHIEGAVNDRLEDIIIFSHKDINAKYFEIPSLEANVSNGKFKLDVKASYPHLYTLSYKSEYGKIMAYGGDYFIEASTTKITVDTIAGCSDLNGKTYLEYKNRFLPFMMDGKYDCKLSFIYFLKNKDDNFDNKLLAYTKANPNSYVALWALIKIVNTDGYSILYKNILNSFSEEMKKNHLWKLLKEDIGLIRIKEHATFPILNLKNTELDEVKLELPKAKYILVDYWFHNCRPCIASFPKMKKLYNAYQYKGFEIIGISVDRTKSISKWQESLKSLELNWMNYLDENAVEATTDKIYSFPTTFLLNDKGQIIKKNIEFDELEEILKNDL